MELCSFLNVCPNIWGFQGLFSVGIVTSGGVLTLKLPFKSEASVSLFTFYEDCLQ